MLPMSSTRYFLLKKKTTLFIFILFTIFSMLFIYNYLLFSYTINYESELNGTSIAMNKYFSTKNIIIVGLAKDCSSTIHRLLSDLEIFVQPFHMKTFFFFESNSNDNTLEILLNWKKRQNTHEYRIILNNDEWIEKIFNLSANELQGMDRESKYVWYRNFLLQTSFSLLLDENPHAFQSGIHFNLDINDLRNTFWLALDMDLSHFQSSPNFILNEIYIGNVLYSFNVLCMNGYRYHNNIHYDTYAAVDVNDHWWRGYIYEWGHFHSISSYFKFLKVKYFGIFSNRKRFIPMKSCFGGMAIYSSILDVMHSECRYISWKELQKIANERNTKNGRKLNEMYSASFIVEHFLNLNFMDRGNTTCEHIPFHYCLINTMNLTFALASHAIVQYAI